MFAEGEDRPHPSKHRAGAERVDCFLNKELIKCHSTQREKKKEREGGGGGAKMSGERDAE